MNNISENCTLEAFNVFSFRGKFTQQQVQQKLLEMNQIIAMNSASKNGPTFSATFAIENNGGQTIMDTAVYIPLDRAVTAPEGYKFQPVFRLKNAVKIRHTGNPMGLQDSINQLMAYINERQYTPATAGYNVTVHEPMNQADIESLIVDIYVGVNDNIL